MAKIAFDDGRARWWVVKININKLYIKWRRFFYTWNERENRRDKIGRDYEEMVRKKGRKWIGERGSKSVQENEIRWINQYNSTKMRHKMTYIVQREIKKNQQQQWQWKKGEEDRQREREKELLIWISKYWKVYLGKPPFLVHCSRYTSDKRVQPKEKNQRHFPLSVFFLSEEKAMSIVHLVDLNWLSIVVVFFYPNKKNAKKMKKK